MSLIAISSVSASAETTGTNLSTAPTYICGDVDMDGVVTIKDATLTQMYVAKLESFDYIQLQLADCDSKKDVQISDATTLQMHIAKLLPELPKNIYGYKIGDEVTLAKAILMKGSDFDRKAYDLSDEYTNMTFSRWSNYSHMFKWEDGIILDEGERGLIRGFYSKDGTSFYVLSDSKIYLNADCKGMFFNDFSIEKVNFYNTDASNAVNMIDMFNGCRNLKKVYTTGLKTPNLKYMSGMFYNCISLESISLPTFDTSNDTSLNDMFSGCKALKNLDITNFDTSSAMRGMFGYCSGLTELSVSNFSTSKVTDMSSMFLNCENLKKLDISSFYTTSLTNCYSMFDTCSKLEVIYATKNANFANVTDSTSMFNKCYALVGGNGTEYDSKYTDKTYARLDTTEQKGYFSKKPRS